MKLLPLYDYLDGTTKGSYTGVLNWRSDDAIPPNTNYLDFSKKIPQIDHGSINKWFTIEFWVKVNVPPASGYSSLFCHVNNYRNPFCGINTEGRVVLSVAISTDNVSQTDMIVSTNPVNDGAWHHVAYAFIAERFILWIDGNKAGEKNASGNINTSLGLRIGFGHNGEVDSQFDGGIAGLEMYEGFREPKQNLPRRIPDPSEDAPEIGFVVLEDFLTAIEPEESQRDFGEFHYDVLEDVLPAIRGGTLIGGNHSITGTVKKADENGILRPYTEAVVFLADQETGNYQREQIETPNGLFELRDLRENRNYSVFVKDGRGKAYKAFIDVTAPAVLDVVLEEETQKPPKPKSYKVAGKVLDHTGQPIQRYVAVHSRTDGTLLGMARSEADGTYSIDLSENDPVYVVCLPNNQEDINAKIFDRVIPIQK
jgi:hypothetical protein